MLPLGDEGFVMSQSRPDDVGSLLSQIDLDSRNYKVFRGASRINPQTRQQEFIESERESKDLPALAVRVGTTEPAPPRDLERNPVLSEAETYVHRNGNWTGLDAALGSSDAYALRDQALSSTRQITVPAISFFSLSGGVGVTSLVAALARISARQGEQSLLLDAGTPSLLPFYFGARAARPHVCTFIDPAGKAKGAVHIASRQEEPPSGEPEAWIWRSLASVLHETDVLLADVPVHNIGDDLKVFLEQTIGILVLVPDVRCLMSLRQIEKLAARPEANGAAQLLPYLLLNGFEPSNSLHLEIHNRMATQFKDRLIPLTIRRDYHVSDALAHGMTVIDYAPASPATEDLYRLAEWLKPKHLKRRATSAPSR
jgi:cellulose synthase operon protein YhjQ